MKKTFYAELSKVFGLVLLLVGIGALIGGFFAQNYVTSQLKQESITMPDQKGVDALSDQKAKDALKPFVGKQMTTGTQAQVYANDFIWEHMQTACKTVKAADGTALPAVPADKCTYAGIGDVAGAATDANAKAAYNAVRASNFQGDALRSMLLTAYAFWLIGTIAKVAGVLCLVLGAVLAGYGFTRKASDGVAPVTA